MSSYIYYKFKSQKTEQKIAFDGTGITVFDLKKEIILSNNFGKASELDLLLFDSSEKEYTDDTQIIPRSTSVIAKRMPASKPGKGNAALYVSGVLTISGPSARSDVKAASSTSGAPSTWSKFTAGANSKRFDGKEEKHRSSTAAKDNVEPGALAMTAAAKAEHEPETNVAEDEAQRIRAMFQANAEHWEETQERMSHATPILSAGRGTARRSFHTAQPVHAPDPKPLPPGYVCHRCSKRGHWIQDCPTNDDRDYDNRPRIKRTTGIPRSFLKPVDAPQEGAPQGIMVTPEGGFVIAQPDVASWEKQRARPAPLTAADVREKLPSDASLACPICRKLLRDAVKTPCCSKTFDEECIQTHLLESDFVCPSCHSKVASLDRITPDTAARDRVRRHIEEEIAKSVAPLDLKTPESQPQNAAQGKSSPSLALPKEDPEITFESQPGAVPQDSDGAGVIYNGAYNGPGDGSTNNPLDAEITSTQSQIQHVMMMLNSPQLTPQMRLQFQMQLPQLTMHLNQLQQMSIYNDSYLNGGPIGMGTLGMQGHANEVAGFGSMNAVGMGYGGNGYSSGPTFNNPGLLNDADSPYQRVAPNNRRRAQKRERPEDFVDVNGVGHKHSRYFE